MNEIIAYTLGVATCMALYYFMKFTKKKSENKKEKVVIGFMTSLGPMNSFNPYSPNYTTSTTWDPFKNKQEIPLLKEDVWEMCVDLYESKVIDSEKFREVSKLLDNNRIREAFELLNS
jgi:hypothetical protein